MGGMFTVLKVRKDQPPGDYSNPGWFKHPPGTQPYEYTGQMTEPTRPAPATTAANKNVPDTVGQAQKPKSHAGH
jgi:hypothetical protein